MTFQCFSENQWLYPDTPVSPAPSCQRLHLEGARGTSVSFQLLTDREMAQNTPVAVRWDCGALPCTVYQLLPAVVDKNSSDTTMTTDDYQRVAHFVTRQAPFQVYDITREMDDGILQAGRAAFYIRIFLPAGSPAGVCSGTLGLSFAGEELLLPVEVQVHACTVPAGADGAFHMINWLDVPSIEQLHHLPFSSPAFAELLDRYLQNQLDMRNDYLMLPSGVPVRDSGGKVVDFDFSRAVFVGNAALKAGFRQILGGFVARFQQWDQKEHFLLWDRSVSVTSFEGYRQLKLYFEKIWKLAGENGWLGRYMQCLVDEPQFPNSEHYRILSCICRKFLPGVPINDPVESTDLEGAVDVWVVKQAVYELHLDRYRQLQELGEEIWIYTCGFPAGAMMNRVIDLPLLVSRLPMWMCYAYDAKGFLHWGYNVHNPEVERSTCFRPTPGSDASFPAGNSFVVYPGEKGPWYSLRGHLQRAGAEDYELLWQLGQRDREQALALIRELCTSFSDYDPSPEHFSHVRHRLLEALDACCPQQ